MRFSDQQQRKGLVRWIPADVVVDISDSGGTYRLTPEGRLPNGQSFRFLDKPLGPERSIALQGLRPWTRAGPLAWYESIQSNGLVVTDVFDFDIDRLERIHLVHVPEYGLYHRLVVDAGKLEWMENVVIRNGRDTIRFVEGAVYGPWCEGIKREQGDQSKYEATIDVREGSLDGRFVEIVAVGSNASAARTRALALLGFINLILGPGAYGQVRIDAAIDARRKQPQRYMLYANHQLGYRVSVEDFALGVGLSDLEKLADLGAKSRAIVALERYGQAASSVSEELRFASLVSGIDAVVSSFYGERSGGELSRQRNQAADELVDTKLNDIDAHVRERIRNLLKSPSLLDKFSFYVLEQGMDSGLIETFKKIRNSRNDLFHSGAADKIHASVVDAKKILERIICIEVGIDQRKIWRLDRTMNTVGDFLLPNCGWKEANDDE